MHYALRIMNCLWAFRLRRRAFRYIFSRLRFRLRLQLPLAKDAAPIPNAKELLIPSLSPFILSL